MKEMKMWIKKKYVQKPNGLETTSEARGSDLIRLVWASDPAVYKCSADLDVDGSRQLLKLFENTCVNKRVWSQNQKIRSQGWDSSSVSPFAG